MRNSDLDLDAVQRRNREARSFATEQVGGSEYAPEGVMEHFDQDVPVLVSEVGRLREQTSNALMCFDDLQTAAGRKYDEFRIVLERIAQAAEQYLDTEYRSPERDRELRRKLAEAATDAAQSLYGPDTRPNPGGE